LLAIVERFGRVKVLAVVDLVADEYVYGRISRVSREAPVLILDHDRTQVVPGGGVRAQSSGQEILVGNQRLLGEAGIAVEHLAQMNGPRARRDVVADLGVERDQPDGVLLAELTRRGHHRLAGAELAATDRLFDDATGQEVPWQPMPEGTAMFVAQDVPSLGYKTFSIRPDGKTESPRKAVSSETIENDFYRIRFDEAGGKTQNARITVVHNGRTIHQNLEIPALTLGGVGNDEQMAGGIYLQDHGNPVQYRNIWVAELEEEN